MLFGASARTFTPRPHDGVSIAGMCLALLYPLLITAMVWVLLYGAPLSRGQLTVQSLLVLMTLIAAHLGFWIAVFR